MVYDNVKIYLQKNRTIDLKKKSACIIKNCGMRDIVIVYVNVSNPWTFYNHESHRLSER